MLEVALLITDIQLLYILPESRLAAALKTSLPSTVFPLELFPDPVFPTRTSLKSDTGTWRGKDSNSGSVELQRIYIFSQ